MNLSVGIVGLPNVGKSTLFNALLKKQQALAANYPFATIEPNVGVVPVPDARLQKLAEIVAMEAAKHGVSSLPHAESDVRPGFNKKDAISQASLSESKHDLQNISVKVYDELALNSLSGGQTADSNFLPPIKPATVEFVDIAGLVKGASEGAGLGNKFLSHIREVKVVCHVVRAFTDEDVVREGSVDPESDYNTIKMELILADLQTASKQRESKAVKTDQVKKSAVEKLYKALNQGNAARDTWLTNEERDATVDLFLLSNKAEVVVLNVDERDYSPEGITAVTKKYAKLLKQPEEKFAVICAKIESELSELSEDEQKQYLSDLGLRESGLERLIQKAYETLGLISFLTAGEKEVRAWTIKRGINAQMAAGEIHTDFIKKFIKAEVVGYNDFVEIGGWKKARELGKARQEGRDYVMQDGDVVEFKIGS